MQAAIGDLFDMTTETPSQLHQLQREGFQYGDARDHLIAAHICVAWHFLVRFHIQRDRIPGIVRALNLNPTTTPLNAVDRQARRVSVDFNFDVTAGPDCLASADLYGITVLIRTRPRKSAHRSQGENGGRS